MLNRLLVVLLILFFVVGGYVAYTAVTLPNVRTALETGVEPTQTSQIFARDKSLIMAYGKFQHKPVPLSEIPPALIDALVSTEDRRFYQHKGIDPIGVLRAIVRNVRTHGVHEGGSTLTQQLARNIFLSNERSMQRKIKEALLALKLEQQLTKQQILELYLNNVYFGEGAYGVGAASNIYFGKKPMALSKAECALLAGLPQAPSVYSPFSNPGLAIKRRNEVLQNMVENHKLAQTQATSLESLGVHLNPNGRNLSSSDKSPFFNRYVIGEATTMLDMDEQTFWQQGIKIYTTLDPRAESIAEAQVRGMSAAFGRTGRKQQAALFSLDSEGGIIAYVGGKDFGISQFDRVSQARRQAGSLFKVFVYTTAMERGFSPLTVYKDAAVTFGNWTPQNYDKGHHGFMSLAQALVQSNNVIAVKVLHDLTPEAVIQTAQRMGIQSPLQPNLSLALGSADVTLKEMTGAFSIFSNNGIYAEPYAIEKIVDHDGRVLYQHRPERRMVLQRTPRDTMVELMEGVVKFGTGKEAAFNRPAAGKTGTSDDYRDAWFIGYTPEVTTGVWVGNDDNSQMPGTTGGSIPARIWRAYMSRLLSGMPKRDFDLSSALPVEEKDFFVYNLANLSASEEKVPTEEVPTGDVQGDNPVDPEGANIPNADLTGSPEGQPQNPELSAPPISPILPRGDGGQLPGTDNPASQGSNPGEDRYFDFKHQPPPERYNTGGNPPLRTPRFSPDSAGNNSRPIVDPVGGNRSVPRAQPLLPQRDPSQQNF